MTILFLFYRCLYIDNILWQTDILIKRYIQVTLVNTLKGQTPSLIYLFIFSYPYILEKRLFFRTNFNKRTFWWIYKFWGLPNPKIVISAVCLWVFYQHNSKTNYNRSLKFNIIDSFHIQMVFETFHENWRKVLFTHTKEFLYITA